MDQPGEGHRPLMGVTKAPDDREPVVLGSAVQEEAQRAQSRIQRPHAKAVKVTVVLADDAEIDLPVEFADTLLWITSHVASGRTVLVNVKESELTTSRAAELLRMSRPTFIKLLEKGDVPHRMVGRHRRVALSDLLSYQDRVMAARHDAYRLFVRDADALGLDDGV